jgi:hypothetical protein
MTLTGFFYPGKNLVLKSFTGIMLLFSAISMSAQSLPDFSGVWIQDKNKSDFYKNFNVKCTIIQTKESLNVKTTFSDSSNTEMATRESTFTLDGKETTDSQGAKKSAKWSPDKKVLTTSDTKDYGGDLVGVTSSYTISGNGLILTVKTSDIKPFVKNITQVFNKKQ